MNRQDPLAVSILITAALFAAYAIAAWTGFFG